MSKNSIIEPGTEYQEALRIMSTSDPDVLRATKLLEDGVLKGDPHAAYALGTWYFHGSNGLAKDRVRGVDLMRTAAEANIPNALFDLAVCYEGGTAVPRDPAKAFRLYLQAAIRGDAQAIFEVGRCYSYGIGVVADDELADVWITRAEELGTFEND